MINCFLLSVSLVELVEWFGEFNLESEPILELICKTVLITLVHYPDNCTNNAIFRILLGKPEILSYKSNLMRENHVFNSRNDAA